MSVGTGSDSELEDDFEEDFDELDEDDDSLVSAINVLHALSLIACRTGHSKNQCSSTVEVAPGPLPTIVGKKLD